MSAKPLSAATVAAIEEDPGSGADASIVDRLVATVRAREAELNTALDANIEAADLAKNLTADLTCLRAKLDEAVEREGRMVAEIERLDGDLDSAREQIAGMRQDLSSHEETLAEYRRSALGELEPDEAEPVKIAAVIERLRQERDRAREEARARRALAQARARWAASLSPAVRDAWFVGADEIGRARGKLAALGIDPDAPEDDR